MIFCCSFSAYTIFFLCNVIFIIVFDKILKKQK